MRLKDRYVILFSCLGCHEALALRPPLWRASRIRNDSPSVTTTMLWCSRRSSRETAVVSLGRNALSWELFGPLGTWHMRAVHDRISAARPDLLPLRRPSGVYSLIRTSTPLDRIQRRLISLHVWNLLNGTYTWLRNRAIDLRAASLRLTLRH